MPVLPVKVQEIDHVAVHHPIVDVAKCAAEYEYDGNGGPGFMAMKVFQPVDQYYTDHQRQGYEEPALPTRSAGQEAERCSSVMQQRQVEHRNHRNRVAVSQHGGCHGLGAEIQSDHQYRQPKPLQFASGDLLRHGRVHQA